MGFHGWILTVLINKICTFHTFFSKKDCCFWNFKLLKNKKMIFGDFLILIRWNRSLLFTFCQIFVKFLSVHHGWFFWCSRSEEKNKSWRVEKRCFVFLAFQKSTFQKPWHEILEIYIFWTCVREFLCHGYIFFFPSTQSLYILQKLAIGFLRQRRTLIITAQVFYRKFEPKLLCIEIRFLNANVKQNFFREFFVMN